MSVIPRFRISDAMLTGMALLPGPSLALCPREVQFIAAGPAASPLPKQNDVHVTVEVTVAPDGSVENATIVQSSGNRNLDSAALRAAKHSKYLPKLAVVPQPQERDAKSAGGNVTCKAVTGSYLFKVTFSPDG